MNAPDTYILAWQQYVSSIWMGLACFSFILMITFPFVFSHPEVYVRFLIAGGTHIFQVSVS